ncbi:unnamed protein product, partial [Ectocarpus sp. 13 AM-2016]
MVKNTHAVSRQLSSKQALQEIAATLFIEIMPRHVRKRSAHVCAVHQLRKCWHGQRQQRNHMNSELTISKSRHIMARFHSLTSVLGIWMSRAEFSPSDDLPPAFSIR